MDGVRIQIDRESDWGEQWLLFAFQERKNSFFKAS
jgi:hypothetical protein